jgi:hypothetical protein
MQNGGGSNEKIVLLDDNLNVVDAVSRLSTPSSSINITTPALSGGCASQTFNLSNMSISYETVSSSTGIDNSYARKVDGDCGWVKTTSISAHAPNKTGSTSSASYEFNTLTASECTGTTGSISINVSSVSVATLFPMNYTLAYDADSNNAFSSADHYSYGVDSSASSIDINSLAYGRYRITVGTSDGCNLKSFDFYIFNCYGIVLPLKILYFKYNGIKDNQFVFDYKVSEPENLEEVVLEAEDGNVYKPVTRVKGHFRSDMLVISAPVSNFETFRLRLADKFGRITYSPILKTSAQSVRNKYWPNPVNDKLSFYLDSDTTTTASYIIYNAVGIKLQQKVFVLRKGGQVISIPTDKLNNGNYYLNISPRSQNQTMYIPFIKGKL